MLAFATARFAGFAGQILPFHCSIAQKKLPVSPDTAEPDTGTKKTRCLQNRVSIPDAARHVDGRLDLVCCARTIADRTEEQTRPNPTRSCIGLFFLCPSVPPRLIPSVPSF
ncbi:hypothetical protein N658DRAFT_186336 [Parathielavia hyrcaniae]|uniref:Uncharacterized protein n=1 Tax=Parathielavia hyrcaniae TaxID=113614 RepID=A0AAN6Q6V0_9PEZI|nr:hypothetical protein N658DRAFT_186336 [Parathielavia hyrcaniae]